MRDPPSNAVGPAPIPLADCWKRIGVHGDRSCAQLEQHVHCRNCPSHAAAAAALLERDVPTDYIADWTRHFAQEIPEQLEAQSVFVFRVGAEWLALPTPIFHEVADLGSIHSLPNRRHGMVLGVANVRGELLVCVSLGKALALQRAPESTRAQQRGGPRRLLVIGSEGQRLGFPVEEAHGIHRVRANELKEVPAIVAQAAATHSRAVFAWQRRTVGLLDARLLLDTLNRSLG